MPATKCNQKTFLLDREVYSNTGAQASKSTPIGAVAQFAAGGKGMAKKDIGMMAMAYGHVYVANVSLANPGQVVKVFIEAEAYDGPSITIACAHCTAHGINMTTAVDEQQKVVSSGYWPLYRYNPALAAEGKNPLQLDSKAPATSCEDSAIGANRYKVLKKSSPEASALLRKKASAWPAGRFEYYQKLAALSYEK